MGNEAQRNCFDAIAEVGIVPVINIPRPELAVPLAKALRAGGIPILEVTLRNDTALESLRRIKAEDPAMLVGAGTVLTCAQVDDALAAGADYIVTPGFNPRVVAHCQAAGVPVLPGCVTPTEIEAGREAGLRLFKFFPSEQLGGVKTIRELCGPYRDVRFVPTSGITLANMPTYLSCDCVAAVGGSCMAPAALVRAGEWTGITALCREAVRASLGFQIMHVGINGGPMTAKPTPAAWPRSLICHTFQAAGPISPARRLNAARRLFPAKRAISPSAHTASNALWPTCARAACACARSLRTQTRRAGSSPCIWRRRSAASPSICSNATETDKEEMS